MIVSIDAIEREARAAAEAGKTPADACSLPFGSAAGKLWLKTYNACGFDLAVAAYRAAINESSSVT